jgi:hypothetical protein
MTQPSREIAPTTLLKKAKRRRPFDLRRSLVNALSLAEFSARDDDAPSRASAC